MESESAAHLSICLGLCTLRLTYKFVPVSTQFIFGALFAQLSATNERQGVNSNLVIN